MTWLRSLRRADLLVSQGVLAPLLPTFQSLRIRAE